MTDIINQLAGIADGAPLGVLRASRDVTYNAARGSYQALLEPDDPGGLSRFERDAVAYRIALLEKSEPVIAHHRERLLNARATGAQLAAIERFPDGGGELDSHLAAALTHADLLTTSPKSATREALVALEATGFSTRDIVSLSQLIAFISFEVRLLAALRALREEAA